MMLSAGTRLVECAGPSLFRSPILIEEQGLAVKNLVSEQEKCKAYALRHDVFCKELGWVLRSDNNLEMDSYDSHAIFFGVLDRQSNLLAFLRLILPVKPFMMENEFLFLTHPGIQIRKEPDAAEISRLCVAPRARNEMGFGNFGMHGVSMLLFKGLYLWSLRNDIRYLYAVTEYKIYKLFRLKGFPYRLIGRPTTMPDGVVAVAVMMDWKEFDSCNASKRPELFAWFMQLQSAAAQGQPLPPEFCSQPLISAECC